MKHARVLIAYILRCWNGAVNICSFYIIHDQIVIDIAVFKYISLIKVFL